MLIRQRLTAAAEEILELFEASLSEFEQEVRTQRTLLDAVFRPEVRLRRQGGTRGGRFVCDFRPPGVQAAGPSPRRSTHHVLVPFPECPSR